MFTIHCDVCGQRQLASTTSIQSLRNGPDGPVADVRCALGHLVEHDFRTGRSQAVPHQHALAS